MPETIEKIALPENTPATDEAVAAYLKYSYRFAEIAATAERDALILKVCEQLEITVTDEELQAAGNKFREENKLLGASETFAWLEHQRISAEDWTQGIRISLLTQKLKEHLFGEAVDAHYISNREQYKRVAISQILVRDLTEAVKISKLLQEEKASFCSLALEYSKGKHSQENGGFAGIKFIGEIMPEIVKAISEVEAGQIIEPVQTKLGYHIIRVEKWFPADFNAVREQVLDSFFQVWLLKGSNPNKSDQQQ